jgi:hypothetical protein
LLLIASNAMGQVDVEYRLVKMSVDMAEDQECVKTQGQSGKKDKESFTAQLFAERWVMAAIK